MNQRNGERLSSSRAFLHPASGRPNLSIVTGAPTRRVLIRNGRATGVEIARAGVVETIAAAREVIVSAGTVNSPQLLMLSGIGPAEELKRHGIEVVCSFHVSLLQPSSRGRVTLASGDPAAKPSSTPTS